MKIMGLNTPHIGMRTFKTALAVTIGLYVSYILDLNTPIFTTIASITTMQPSYYETYKSVRLRIVTCVIGVILGYLLGHVTGDPMIAPLIGGVGVIMCILILLKLKLDRMISLTIIIFMASFVAESDKLGYGANRLLGTLVGVGVSLLVNFIIATPKIVLNLPHILEETYESVYSITRSLLIGVKTPSLSSLQSEITEANNYYKLVKNEIQQPLAPVISLREVEEVVEDFQEVFILLRLLSSMPEKVSHFTKENQVLIGEIFQFTIIEEEEIEKLPDIVSNYHIHTLLVKLIELGGMYKGVIDNEFK